MNRNFDLKSEMLGGIAWVSLSQFFRYGLQFIFIIVLARLLSVEDFGIMAIVMAFMALSFIVGDLGLSSAIVQKKEIRPILLSTSLWICVLAGLIFFLIILNSASIISRFFHKEIIRSLIVAISIKFIIDSFGMVHEAILRKQLFFRRLAFVEIIETLCFGFISITLAINGFGVWSLVYGYLFSSLFKVILLWRVCSWRPILKLSFKGFKEIFDFAKNMLGFKIVSYLAINVDRFIIGRVLGSVSLGYYSIAYRITNLPREKFGAILVKVGFPTFSKIQNDIQKLKQGYLKIITYVSIIVFPFLSGLFILSANFVHVVFTQKWDAMVLPLQYLCISGMFFSITALAGIIFLSTGHPEFELRLAILRLLGMVVAVLFGVRFSIVAVAKAISIYALIINIISQLFVRYLIKMDFKMYLKALNPAIISSAIMLLGLKLFLKWQSLFFSFTDILLLIVCAILGLSIYIFSLYALKPQLVKQMLAIFHKRT